MKFPFLVLLLFLVNTSINGQNPNTTYGGVRKMKIYTEKDIKKVKKSKSHKTLIKEAKNSYADKAIARRKFESKEMKKKRYTDKSYFGHKRKPKIRKRGKRRLCRECGIVH